MAIRIRTLVLLAAVSPQGQKFIKDTWNRYVTPENKDKVKDVLEKGKEAVGLKAESQEAPANPDEN